MPRKGRQDKQGQAHGQRTDLNKGMSAPPTQKPAAPTGMAYGAHKESIEAQQAVPMAGAAPSAPAPAPTPRGAGAGGGLEAAIAAAAAHPAPGPGLAAGSDRPGEPITAGLSTGPGPGPAPPPSPRAADYLARLATEGGDPEMVALAELARRIGA